MLLERAEAFSGQIQTREQRRQLARQVESLRRWTEVHRLLEHRHISRKSHRLLSQRGLGPSLFEGTAAARKSHAATSGVDTLKILLVRISFATDRSGPLTSVTEDGNFTLREAYPEELIDRPPHNRSFYEAHLAGLSEYYRMQSDNRLIIQSQVMPRGPVDSYQLSDLADYGPGADSFWTVESLERLVRGMIGVADSTITADEEEFSLADYDDDNPFTYIIFVHAGGDWQGDINNDSPNDVPTFFISLGEPAMLTHSGGALSECSVIPETVSQDGFIGSIAASLYHEFGHALGLVDIYDTYRGLPQVGVWSLMDTGTNLIANVGIDTSDPPDGIADEALPVLGLLPPSLGAWDKWFLGWLDYATIDNATSDYRLVPVQIPREDYWRYPREYYDFRRAYPRALLGGVSPGEFFLIENRWVPFDGTELPDQEVFFVSDPETGVVLYLGGDEDIPTERPRNTGMYDFFLPESGVLVWHVNMNRIEPNLAMNTINIYGDGLRLVEADGIQDIGVYDAYVLGFFGSYRDPFNEDNGDALYIEGRPSSRAFDRSWTGLALSDIKGVEPGGRSTMSLTATVTPLAHGSPIEVAAIDSAEAAITGGTATPRALAVQSLTPFTFQRDNISVEALVITDAVSSHWDGENYRAKLFAWQPDGTRALWKRPEWPDGAGWEFNAPVSGSPVQIDLSPPTNPVVTNGLVVGLQNGEVLAFTEQLNVIGGLQLQWGPVSVGASLAYAPVPGGSSTLLTCVQPDTLLLLNTPDGSQQGEPLVLADSAGGPFGGFKAPPLPLRPGNEQMGWAVFGAQGWFYVTSSSAGLENTTFTPYIAVTADSSLWRVALPEGDTVSLLVFDTTGMLGSWRLHTTGQIDSNVWQGVLPSGPVTDPAVADLDGDGRHDVILLTATHVRAYQSEGAPLTGFPVALAELFPLPDSTRIAGPVVVGDATGDGVNELFFVTNHGHLFGLDARGRLLAKTPYLWGQQPLAGLAIAPGLSPDERLLWLVESGGHKSAPLERRFTNGRIVGYRLLGSGTASQATSEWLGPEGGSWRLGPVGSVSRLTVSAPWQQDVERVVLYPNPLHGQDLTVRFRPEGDNAARFVIFNLEGEIVRQETISVTGGQMKEHIVPLPDLVSGMYVCQLEWENNSGLTRKTMTLAVER